MHYIYLMELYKNVPTHQPRNYHVLKTYYKRILWFFLRKKYVFWTVRRWPEFNHFLRFWNVLKKPILNHKKRFNNLFTTYKQPLKKLFPKGFFCNQNKTVSQWFLIGFHSLTRNHLETFLEPFQKGFMRPKYSRTSYFTVLVLKIQTLKYFQYIRNFLLTNKVIKIILGIAYCWLHAHFI